MDKRPEETRDPDGWSAHTIGFLRIAKHYDKIAECHQLTIDDPSCRHPTAIKLSTWPQTWPQTASFATSFRSHIEKPNLSNDTFQSLRWPFL
jgi:hypothetical protein